MFDIVPCLMYVQTWHLLNHNLVRYITGSSWMTLCSVAYLVPIVADKSVNVIVMIASRGGGGNSGSIKSADAPRKLYSAQYSTLLVQNFSP